MYWYLRKKMIGSGILQDFKGNRQVNSQKLIEFFYWYDDNMSEFFYFALGLYNKKD